MARLPQTQIFACPACAKLYKRKVDVWFDMRYPSPPSSPPASIPRVCTCGRVFLISEATVIAQLDCSHPHPDALSEYGMDRIDIPEFLRKQDTGDTPQESKIATVNVPPKTPTSAKQALAPVTKKRPGVVARFWAALCHRLGLDGTEAQRKAAKGNPMKEVLWDMESAALPERIAPEGAVPGTLSVASESKPPLTR